MNETDTRLDNSLQGFDPRILFSQGNYLGTVDLVQGGSFREVIGRTIPALWGGAINKNGENPFLGISVILPPAIATDQTSESVIQNIALGIMALRGFEPDLKELQFLRQIVRVVNCPTLEVDDLVGVVTNEGEKRLVAIAESSKYRDQRIVFKPVLGISVIQTPEDLWTKHVVSLCSRCVSIAKRTRGYAIIHVADIPATRAENTKLLVGIDDCYVTNLGYEQDPEEIFNQHIEYWLSLLLNGKTTEVVKDIEKLQLPEVDRFLALAQLFQKAGKNREALDLIDQIQPYLLTLTSEKLIKLSRVAHKAGDYHLASSLLPKDATSISDEMWIEVALELATNLKDNIKIELFDAQLTLLYPHSVLLRENRDRRLLLNCRRANLDTNNIFTTAGFTVRHLHLLESISLPKPNYLQLIEEADEWGLDWLELAIICCAMHAFSIGQSRVAIDIASKIIESSLYGRQAIQIVLSSVRTMMLKEEVKNKEREYYQAPLLATIHFLANHPEDDAIRSSLSTLLSVESCGDLGLPIMATTMLNIAKKGTSIASTEIDTSEPKSNSVGIKTEPNEDTVKHVVQQGLAWLSNKGTSELGVTTLPAEIVGNHPDYVIDYLSRIILRIGAQQGEEVDLEFMEKMVLLVCAICPYATESRNEDLRVIRLLAGHFAIQGQYQQARNLAEQVLIMGQGNKVRLRLAWFAFADIYHRCNNQIEALIGLTCAMATDASIHKEDLWQEVYTAIRILRDLGLLENARKFLPALKTLLLACGLDPETDPRITITELGLRFLEIKSIVSGELEVLIDDLTLCCERDTYDRNDILPLATLLGQAIARADASNMSVKEHTRTTLTKTLGLLGKNTSQMVKTLSSFMPCPIDLAELFNRVQRATYAIDVAGDYRTVRLVARRLLDCQSSTTTAKCNKALAVEILADHTMVLPDIPPNMEVDWPVRYAQSLNQKGLDVVFLAVNNNGELIVTHISEEETHDIEQSLHEQTFQQRMLLWLEDYPRNYGYIAAADGNNEFFTTMEVLDVRLPTPKMLVVVATPMMQQLTANLVLSQPDENGGSHFLGTKTAVGMVPSLTWLSRVRASTRIDNRAYKAWISTPDDLDEGGAMGVTLTRLSGTFKEFGFSVDTGRRLPREMSDAGLAVVIAHGGLTSEGRYIHSIKDEGDLIEAPSELALALGGSEVVILFVCSGGRIDSHPWDNRTVSLPKQLLDSGTRAVIASPWPLDVKVTYRWLEPFLREWEVGMTILQATKKANEAVAKTLGDSPQYSLAMSVYGDVLLTKLVN